jgi:hypothetical protein
MNRSHATAVYPTDGTLPEDDLAGYGPVTRPLR